MELTCPSCGAKHRTEDHPGAFEIHCVCGYSILVPDEASFSLPVEEAAPAAAHSPGPAVEHSEPAVESVVAPEPEPIAVNAPLEMTPPEQLPEGMVYDPFELAQAEAAQSGAVATEFTPNFEMPAESSDADATATGTAPAESAPAAAPARPATAAAPASGQAIVERVQAASMGRLLGADYRLRCEGLERDALVQITQRCLKLLKQRPWLETEVRGRKIDLESFPDSPVLARVPELLAMEIYLACAELGGSCSLERME